MSMLRNVYRVQASSTPGYVCYTCRRQLLAARRQQARWLSTSTAPESAGDDWFSNFNELSAENTPIKPRYSFGKDGQNNASGKGEKKPQTRRERIAQGRGNDLDSLKSNLSSRLSSAGAEEEKLSGVFTFDAASQTTTTSAYSPFLAPKEDLSYARERKRRRGRAEFNATEIRRLSARDEDAKAAAAERHVENVESRPRNQQLDDIVKQLQEEFRVKLPEMIRAAARKHEDAKMLGPSRKLRSKDLVREYTAGRTSFDVKEDRGTSDVFEVHEDARPSLEGLVERLQTSKPLEGSSDTAAHPETPESVPEKAPELLDMPKFVSTSPATPSYSRPVFSAEVNERLLLMRKFENALSRPKWGGVTSNLGSDKDANSGFLDALQQDPDRASASLAHLHGHKAKNEKTVLPPKGEREDLLEQPVEESEATEDKLPKPAKSKRRMSSRVRGYPGSIVRKHGSNGTVVRDMDGNHSLVYPNGSSVKINPRVAAYQTYLANKRESIPSRGQSSNIADEPTNGLASEAFAEGNTNGAIEDKSEKLLNKAPGKPAEKPAEKPNRENKSPEPKKTDRRKRRNISRLPSQDKAVGKAISRVVVRRHLSDSKDATDSAARSRARVRITSTKKTIPAKTEKPEKLEKPAAQPKSPPLVVSSSQTSDVVTVDASNLEITPIEISQPTVPGLEYGLDRVLFNPGVYQLQDPHSRVYNFDPYLQKIMPIVEFDYNALKEYKTSSQDIALSALAREHGKRYIGSTSSMTGTLGHFHYLLSNFRPVNLNMLSRGFPDKADTYTAINRAPNAIFLRHKGNDTYAIDADKEFDGANVLMMLGKSMEKLLTVPTSEYEKYRKGNSHAVSEEERSAPESYEYTTMGDFLMRSQLDAHDSRLPGTGMFDLKTRAVISVRHNTDDFQPMTGYEIRTLQGRYESYEREYYDMIRSTMLKYMLQVRMGRMDGIFIAYHNVERIFGFQYVPLQEMDHALHGQTNRSLGDREFKLSLEMLNNVLNKATAKFPDQSLRLHFEAAEQSIGTGSETTVMWIYAEPMTEEEIDGIQSKSKAKIAEFEQTMMGMEKATQDSPDEAAGSSLASGVDKASETELSRSADSNSASTNDAKPPPWGVTKDYSSTSTNADQTFIKAAEPKASMELSPLFAASIICKSKINDTVVLRPENLKQEDKWEVEYLLQEWETNEAVWARYEDTKEKRKRFFEKLRNEEEDEGAEKRENPYIEFLKSMSHRGREFRGKREEIEAGKEPVVVGQPSYASKAAAEE